MRMLTAKLTVIGLLLLLQACATYSPYYDSYSAVPTTSTYGYSSSHYVYSAPAPGYSYYASYSAGSPSGYNGYRAYPHKHHSRHYSNDNYDTRVIRNRPRHHHGEHYLAPHSGKALKERRHYRKHRRDPYNDKQIARRNHPRHAPSLGKKYNHRSADKHVKHRYVRAGKQTHFRPRNHQGRNPGQNARHQKRHGQNHAQKRTNHRNNKQQTRNRRGQRFGHSQPNRSRTANSGKRTNKAGQSARKHREQLKPINRRLSSNQASRRGVRDKNKKKRRVKRNNRHAIARSTKVHL